MRMRLIGYRFKNISRPANRVYCWPMGCLINNSISQESRKGKRKRLRVVVLALKGKKLSTAKLSNVTEKAKCNKITANHNFFIITIVKFVITVKVLQNSLFCYFGVLTLFPKTAACQKLCQKPCQYNRKPHNSKLQFIFLSLGAQTETLFNLKNCFFGGLL